MIPILYDRNEESFDTLGIGMLSECISCVVTQNLNGSYELVIEYPQSGKRFADLKNERIIKATAEKKKRAQLFTIYQITKPINGIVQVYATHISGRKEFIPIMPFSAVSINDTFSKIPNYVAETNPFTFWTNKNTVANFNMNVPKSLGQVLGGSEGSILDVYKGEYEFDNFEIKLWNHRGQDNGVVLCYGKNITDFEQEENIAATITGICPFWADSEGNTMILPEKTVYSPNASNFAFKRTVVKDFSDSFETAPTEAQLRARATSYISQAEIGVPNVSLKISFEHLSDYADYENLQLLEEVHLGDTVHVFFEPLNVTATARVVKTKYNTLLERYKSVEIGSVRANMSKIVADLETETDTKITETKSTLEKAMQEAIKQFSGIENGYIVWRTDSNGKPYELLAMDTDSINTATNVLRLNYQGLAYSSNGIQGPYTVAITGLGITADSITGGEIRGISGFFEHGEIGNWTITQENLHGEDNFDYSDVSIFNVAAIKSYLLGHTTEEEAIELGGDVDGDGHITLNDLYAAIQLILQYVQDSGTYSVELTNKPFNVIQVKNNNDVVFSAGITGMYAAFAVFNDVKIPPDVSSAPIDTIAVRINKQGIDVTPGVGANIKRNGKAVGSWELLASTTGDSNWHTTDMGKLSDYSAVCLLIKAANMTTVSTMVPYSVAVTSIDEPSEIWAWHAQSQSYSGFCYFERQQGDDETYKVYTRGASSSATVQVYGIV